MRQPRPLTLRAKARPARLATPNRMPSARTSSSLADARPYAGEGVRARRGKNDLPTAMSGSAALGRS